MNLRGLPWQRWAAVVIPVTVVCFLLALLVPAMLRARTEARKTYSRNNLKQIGLAFHNYDDVYQCLPPGAIVREDGVALHGWPSPIVIYFYATPYYQFIDYDLPWDHDLNRYTYCHTEPPYQIPDIDEIATKDGYGLLCYMGNPNVLHRNSSVKFDDMTAGVTHTWMAGEAAGNYQPWAYPFNWRPLGKRLNDGPDSYGRPSGDGAFLLMADGSVPWVSNKVEEKVLSDYAAAPPVANADQIAVPSRRFEYSTSIEEWVIDWIDLDKNDDEGWVASEHIVTDTRFRSVIFGSKMKSTPERALNTADVRRVADKFPKANSLQRDFVIDDDVAEVLAEFKSLAFVRAQSLNVSERGLAAIKRMPALKRLRIGEARAADLAALREALPDCEIRAHSVSED
ncbi:hypothetical protein Pan258_13970 [Symmachiella dynata]|uniref:DUF1559 family PulG-like putative transporter n=1 Tax=Symmachiella dynata TaxID=2527995 RepID=UPI0011882E41|nr:DUF1559 domain-containing protein [Symmachiella dynata]QDT47363.1 hypothetical protein Pan258_13970 [Symmachiella dynata]